MNDSPNNKKLSNSKAKILSDLELLHQSLIGENANIPTLTDNLGTSDLENASLEQHTKLHAAVSEAEALAQHHAEKERKTENTTEASRLGGYPEPLPGQQSLFGNETPPPKSAKTKSAENSDNPFLPPHIRERLREQKALRTSLLAEHQAAQSASAQKRVSPPAPNSSKELITPAQGEQLIDEVLADYLPKIETALRTKLKEKLAQLTRDDKV